MNVNRELEEMLLILVDHTISAVLAYTSSMRMPSYRFKNAVDKSCLGKKVIRDTGSPPLSDTM